MTHTWGMLHADPHGDVGMLGANNRRYIVGPVHPKGQYRATEWSGDGTVIYGAFTGSADECKAWSERRATQQEQP